MDGDDIAVRDFLRAGGSLLEAAMTAIKAEDPAAMAGLAAYLNDGGTMTVCLRLAPRQGVGEVQIGVLDAAGSLRVLRSMNIRRQADA